MGAVLRSDNFVDCVKIVVRNDLRLYFLVSDVTASWFLNSCGRVCVVTSQLRQHVVCVEDKFSWDNRASCV